MTLPSYKPEFLAHITARRIKLREDLAAIVPPQASIVLEIGCGHGHFLARYAHEHPGRICLGVDVIGERIDRARRKSTRAKLANCHFIRAEARELIECLPPGTMFTEIWVLFPDPWPKKRHHKNRILQPPFFAFLSERMEQGSRLYFRTDHSGYFEAVADFLPGLAGWTRDPAAPWPIEQETVFQARAPAYRSLVVVRTANPAKPAGTAASPPLVPEVPTSPA